MPAVAPGAAATTGADPAVDAPEPLDVAAVAVGVVVCVYVAPPGVLPVPTLDTGCRPRFDFMAPMGVIFLFVKEVKKQKCAAREDQYCCQRQRTSRSRGAGACGRARRSSYDWR